MVAQKAIKIAAYINGVWPPSAACECGAEDQAVDRVVHCPIHRPPRGLHGLTVLDDVTIEWLLNACPEIYCGLAMDKNKLIR